MSTDLFDLSGSVALVTGSTRGIGRAIVEQFCRAGASCVVSSEDEAAVRAASEELENEGFAVAGQVCDVTDAAALPTLVNRAVAEFGGLDILVCNAGITGEAGPITEVDESDYRRVFDINLHSMVTLANCAYPHLKKRGGGSVILVSSISALRGNASINAYALAKAGVAQLARNLAVQWGPDNIRSNAISPGLIRTELSAPLMADADFMERRMQMTPLRRPGEMREIAGCAHFLASAAGAFVNGHNLVADGGTTITDGS
jgi:NAD(P)-dependent dehydrogenase (short-subunit alcohol dehydrogenase family)